jgi:sugar lactone lactonase YvrE
MRNITSNQKGLFKLFDNKKNISFRKITFSVFILCIFFILGCPTKNSDSLDFTIVSPLPDKTLSSNFVLELAGKSSSPITTVLVKINKKTITLPVGSNVVKPNKKWTLYINLLKKGENIISVSVVNLKKERVTKTVRVFKKIIAPQDPNAISVEIISPSENQNINSDFTLELRTISNKAVTSFWIKHSKTNNQWVQLPASDNLKWKLKLADFEEGVQIISVTAYNGVKYAKTASVTLKVTKPLPASSSIKVEILSPDSGKEYSENISLRLKIISSAIVQRIWYKHEGTGNNWVELQFAGNDYNFSLNIADFNNGLNNITISAYNGKEYGYAKVAVNIKRNVPMDRGPGFGNCYEYSGDFGGYGNAPGKFEKPYYIQISNERKLYVTDSRLNRVSIFTHTGVFIKSFGKKGSGKTEFDNPVGICIYKNQRIYISDYFNRRVAVYDLTGKHMKFIYGQSMADDQRFKLTGGVAINDYGELFVVDFDGNKIFKFDYMGNFIKVFGKKGSGKGELNNPTGITISQDGYVYVVDKKNDRVVVFDRNGNYSFTFGHSGPGRGELSRPMGIAVDKYNHIYVSDTRNNRVLKFDHKGKYLCVVAKNLVNPIGIAIDNTTGVVYVVDRDASYIRMYKPCVAASSTATGR